MPRRNVRAMQGEHRGTIVCAEASTINEIVLIAGKLYAVFGKRQGRIVSTENAYGFGGQFRVLATLPVLESFHLARELRTQTSGLASPQLVFSHWEVSGFSRELKGS